MLHKKAGAVEKGIQNTSNILSFIGMGMLLVLMVLGTADVIGRYLFNKPITGTLEISEILMAGMVFFGWPYTQAVMGHVRVDLIVSRFPRRAQALTDFISTLLALALFSLIVWRGIETAISYWHSNRTIDILYIPIFPFQLFVPFGAFFLCLVLIIQLLHSIAEMRKVD